MENLKIFDTRSVRKQRTIKNPVQFSGIGIHKGQEVTLGFCPAEEGMGVVFQRTDLPEKPMIPATVEYVKDTRRSTTIGINEVHVQTVEHVLAAVKAFEIDNLIIEVSDIEPPVGDGSSTDFVNMLEQAGISEQEETVSVLALKEPVFWSEGEVHLVALPHNGVNFSYTLHYPESGVLSAQYYTVELDWEIFKNEIAPCRTFAKYEEITQLMDHGLIKGGSLSNAVVVQGDSVFSHGGLRFPNEMARHKTLDLIGDLALVGFSVNMLVIAIRSGHTSNVAFAKKLYKHLIMEREK